ncbi:hypothetical protein B0H13DRAFT_1882366 [Mycena leptocephala]|nr:hypothetical protein B0H13DRAFT_1882366 [Mycena leptocephala]
MDRDRDFLLASSYFIVDLEKVTFIAQGPAVPGPKAEESPTKPMHSGTPARLKFTGFFGSQESNLDAKSDGPASKRRKTADDRSLEESGDKGEGSSTGRRAQRRQHLHVIFVAKHGLPASFSESKLNSMWCISEMQLKDRNAAYHTTRLSDSGNLNNFWMVQQQIGVGAHGES